MTYVRPKRLSGGAEGWGVLHMRLAFLATPVTLSPLFLSHIPIVMAFSRNNFS